MTDNAFLLARQPIYDRDLGIFGYELLFRSPVGLTVAQIGGSAASSQVMLNAFTNLNIEQVAMQQLAFVNFTRELLQQSPPFPPSQLVVEVLEDVDPDPSLLQHLSRLRSEGYLVALDDFIPTDSNLALLEHADIVKLDVLNKSEREIREMMAPMSGRPLRLLAEKVETHEVMQLCKQLGFDFFQGYFLSRPQLVGGSALGESQLAVISLLAKLNDPETTLQQLEAILGSDAVLAYKLIRLANSPLLRSSGHTETLRRAIQVMGLEKIRAWATLLAFTKLSTKPRSLMSNTLARAYMCQQIGQHIDKRISPDRYFTIGLLSMLEAFLDRPISELSNQLDMPQDMTSAILEHKGSLGKALSTTIHFERAEWELLPWLEMEASGLDAATITGYYLQALGQASEAEGLLAGS